MDTNASMSWSKLFDIELENVWKSEERDELKTLAMLLHGFNREFDAIKNFINKKFTTIKDQVKLKDQVIANNSRDRESNKENRPLTNRMNVDFDNADDHKSFQTITPSITDSQSTLFTVAPSPSMETVIETQKSPILDRHAAERLCQNTNIINKETTNLQTPNSPVILQNNKSEDKKSPVCDNDFFNWLFEKNPTTVGPQTTNLQTPNAPEKINGPSTAQAEGERSPIIGGRAFQGRDSNSKAIDPQTPPNRPALEQEINGPSAAEAEGEKSPIFGRRGLQWRDSNPGAIDQQTTNLQIPNPPVLEQKINGPSTAQAESGKGPTVGGRALQWCFTKPRETDERTRYFQTPNSPVFAQRNKARAKKGKKTKKSPTIGGDRLLRLFHKDPRELERQTRNLQSPKATNQKSPNPFVLARKNNDPLTTQAEGQKSPIIEAIDQQTTQTPNRPALAPKVDDPKGEKITTLKRNLENDFLNSSCSVIESSFVEAMPNDTIAGKRARKCNLAWKVKKMTKMTEQQTTLTQLYFKPPKIEKTANKTLPETTSTVKPGPSTTLLVGKKIGNPPANISAQPGRCTIVQVHNFAPAQNATIATQAGRSTTAEVEAQNPTPAHENRDVGLTQMLNLINKDTEEEDHFSFRSNDSTVLDDTTLGEDDLLVKSKTPKKDAPVSASFLNDFDNPPDKNDAEPDYAYQGDVVRGKEERKKLEGWDCEECEKFYKVLKLPPDDLKQKMKACSKHRGKFRPHEETYDGFWDLTIRTSQSQQTSSQTQSETQESFVFTYNKK